jgi:predicted nucleic acid-binding protein
MAQRFLIDTSALLAHARKEPGWERVSALFEQRDCEVLASAVSLTEFARRLRDLGSPVEGASAIMASYRDLLDEVVPVDGQVARTAFEIGCATPERLPLVDALIAASAHERGATLVHRDRHLAAIPADLLSQLDLAFADSRRGET